MEENNKGYFSFDYKNFNYVKKTPKNFLDLNTGSFYTPFNLSYNLVLNSILKKIDNSIIENLSSKKALEKILFFINEKKLKKTEIINFKILEPTSGTGSFIFAYLIILLEINSNFKPKDQFVDEEWIKISNNIFAIDINKEAIEELKITLKNFFSNFVSYSNLRKMKFPGIICQDFLEFDTNEKFDFIVGNPPFFKINKNSFHDFKTANTKNFYSLIIEKAINFIKKETIFSFIAPISFQSTKSMKPLRDLIFSKFSKIFISSFSDRPSSLFLDAHVRINIVTLINELNFFEENKIYVTSYSRKFKNEEKFKYNFFEISSIKKIDLFQKSIPKIGNNTEFIIFQKMINTYNKNKNLRINFNYEKSIVHYFSRIGLWPKFFSFFDVGDSITNSLCFNSNILSAILNSSLFFLFWTMVGDGWHVLKSDISFFEYVFKDLTEKDKRTLEEIEINFENDLEKNKVLINSAQTSYIYQHKLFKKKYIDKIDKILCSFLEIDYDYVSNFALKYRGGVL